MHTVGRSRIGSKHSEALSILLWSMIPMIMLALVLQVLVQGQIEESNCIEKTSRQNSCYLANKSRNSLDIPNDQLRSNFFS